jgi:hypothetical protein
MGGRHFLSNQYLPCFTAAVLLLAASTAQAQTVYQPYHVAPHSGVAVVPAAPQAVATPQFPGCPNYCIVVHQAPPVQPVQVVAQPRVVQPGHSWVPGHYVWNGRGWQWQGAYWQPNRPGQVWIAPYYHAGPAVYVHGHWAPAAQAPHYAHHLQQVAARAQHRAYRHQLRAQLRAMEMSARMQARAHAEAVRAQERAHRVRAHQARQQHRAYRRALRAQLVEARRAARLQERQARLQARAHARAQARAARHHHHHRVVVAQPAQAQVYISPAW